MAAVPFDIDPVRTPLMVRPRPTNRWFRPLPPGALEYAARPVLAPEVRAGDLIIASFTNWPTPYRVTRGAGWVPDPYVADPGPWDPRCACSTCSMARGLLDPAPSVGNTVVLDRSTGACDLWDAHDYALVIPATSLLLPVSA